ncbi:hypothetical protein DYB32_006002 [Aphanomyces invadans]|uniref:EF-hand domain-containing protein n=1 Tax=Aphanomyces invadans TaxID=157072 RepID=A0A418ASY7_9STRA|nr:hypothetical protein DYB32_006002 [Aphanomyces invadans]
MSQVHLICSEAAATLRELLLTAVQRGISVEDSFGHFDPIGDGVVDLTQFIQGLRTLGIPLRVEAASMLLRQLSDTSTTHLTVQDFHRLCVQLPKRQKKKGPPTSNAKRYKVSSDCAPISPAQQPSTEERVAQAQGLPEWAHDRSKRALKDLQALSKHRKQQLRQVPCDDFSDPMSDDDDEIDGESGQGSGHNGGSSTSVVAPPSSMLPPTPLPETTTDDRPQYQVFSVSDQVALRYAILTAPVDFVDATMQSSGEDQAVEHSKVSRHVRTPKSQLRLKLIIVADVFQTLDAIDAWLVSVFQVYASAKVLVIGHPSRMDSPTTGIKPPSLQAIVDVVFAMIVVNNATLAAWMGQLLTHLDHAREWMAQPKYGTGATPHILVGFGSGASVAAHFTLITAPQQPKLHVLNQALHALVLVNGFCCTEGIKAKIQQVRVHVGGVPDNGWIPPAQVSYFQDKRQLALSFNDAMKSSGGLIHVSWLKAGHELLQERPAFFPQFLDQVVTAAHVAIQQHASPTPDDADVEISPSSGRNASAKSTDVASRLTDGSDDDELRLNQATTDGTPNTTVTPQLLPQVQELYATVGLKGIRQELIDRDIDVPLGNDDQVMWMLHQALVAEAQAARAAEAKTIARKELERQHELQLGRQEDEKRQKKLRYGLDGPIRSSEIPAVVRGIQCLIEDVTAIRAQKCTSIAQQAASQAKQRAIQAALDDTNRMHSNLLRVAMFDRMMQSLAVLQKRTDAAMGALQTKAKAILAEANEVLAVLREEQEREAVADAKRLTAIHSTEARVQTIEIELKRVETLTTPFIDTDVYIAGAPQRVDRHILSSNLRAERGRLQESLDVLRAEAVTAKAGRMTMRAQGITLTNDLGVPITNSASQPSNFPTQPPHAPPSMAVIRAKGVHDRAVDEMQWVALDRLVSPEHYLSLPEQDIEEMRRNPHYQTSLTAAHVQRLLQLPERINLALPFLKSSAEIHAHKLLRQYTKGDGEGVFNAKDVAFAPPLLIHDLDTAMRKQLGAVVRQKPLETCTPDEQAWRQCDALLNPPASPSDINVLPDQLPFGMSSVEELRHVTTLSQSDHPAWKVLHQHGSLAPPRVVVVHTLADIVGACVFWCMNRRTIMLSMLVVAAPEHCTMLVDSNQQAKLMDVAECRLRARQSATHEFRVHTAALHLSISIVFEGTHRPVSWVLSALTRDCVVGSAGKFTSVGYQVGRLAAMLYYMSGDTPTPLGQVLYSDVALNTRESLGRVVLRHQPAQVPIAQGTYHIVVGCPYSIVVNCHLVSPVGDFVKHAKQLALTYQARLPVGRQEIAAHWQSMRLAERKLNLVKDAAADAMAKAKEAEVTVASLHELLHSSGTSSEGATESSNRTHILAKVHLEPGHNHSFSTPPFVQIREADRIFTKQCKLHTIRLEECRDIQKALTHLASLHADLLLERARLEQALREYRDFLPDATGRVEGHTAGFKIGYALGAEYHAIKTAKMRWRDLSALKSQLRTLLTSAQRVRRKYKNDRLSLNPTERQWVLLDRIRFPDFYLWEQEAVHASDLLHESTLAPPGMELTAQEKALLTWTAPDLERVLTAPVNQLRSKELQLRKTMLVFRDTKVSAVPAALLASWRTKAPGDLKPEQREWVAVERVLHPDLYSSKLAPAIPTHWTKEKLLALERHLRDLMWHYDNAYCVEVVAPKTVPVTYHAIAHNQQGMKVEVDVDMRCRLVQQELDRVGVRLTDRGQQEQLQLEREQLGPNGCMACKSTPCTWIPYLGDRVATIEHRVHLLQDEIERVKRSKESIVSSTMCLAAVRSGGGAVALRKMDLFAELTLECRVWEKHLRLRAIDTELHATYNWPGDHFETVALHGFTQMQQVLSLECSASTTWLIWLFLQTEKVKAALTREQNSLVAHLVSYEVMEDILEYMLEGWVFGERESHRKVQGYVPSVYTHGPLTVHTLRSMASLRPDTLAADATDLKDITDAKAKFGTPFEKWTPIEVDAQAAQRRGKAVQAGTSVARCVDHDGERWVDEDRSLGSSVATVLNETEQALKFGLFCMTLMYFRGLSLLQKQKKAWNTQASHTTKDAPIKPTALQVERSKQAARQRYVGHRHVGLTSQLPAPSQLDVANAKAKVGRDRKHLREQERMAAYRHKLYAQHRLAKQEAHACTQVRCVVGPQTPRET